MAKGNFFSTLRRAILIFILAAVALGSYLSRVRSTDWIEPLWVTIYPINGDNSEVTQTYIDALEESDFIAIERFIKTEALKFGVTTDDPVLVKLRNQLASKPPETPEKRSLPAVMLWSLKLRYWANRAEATDPKPKGDIRVFVLYYDPEKSPTLKHSLGLQKGLIGVVHGFANAALNSQNNVIITHELLHTLGASDKYRDGNYPIYPHGFAAPEKQPLLPQDHAEIMGGRIPKTQDHAEIPANLTQVVVGNVTAQEINWIP